MEEAFRRMVFNVMARNCDDHTKNISFRLKKGHAWELAPAYDIIFAHNPDSQWTQQHLMSVNGKFKDISVNDMLIEAERFGIGTAQQVIDEVRNSVLRWSDFASEAGVSAEQTKHILNHLNVV
jgi:serine/threonine-protein kinase HipA